MTTAPHGIPTIQSATSQPISTHQYVSAKDRLIGKPRFHFEPTQVMQLLRQRIIGQDAALNEIEKCCMWSRPISPAQSDHFQ